MSLTYFLLALTIFKMATSEFLTALTFRHLALTKLLMAGLKLPLAVSKFLLAASELLLASSKLTEYQQIKQTSTSIVFSADTLKSCAKFPSTLAKPTKPTALSNFAKELFNFQRSVAVFQTSFSQRSANI